MANDIRFIGDREADTQLKRESFCRTTVFISKQRLGPKVGNQGMYQGNAALSLEPYWEKPVANDESASVPVYYYRARYYDPEIGQFTSEDPLRFKAGVNFYAYCGNNPINCNDPTGCSAQDYCRTFSQIIHNYDSAKTRLVFQAIVIT